MRTMKLEIIIPHYKEDIALMDAMMGILKLQRNVNFADFGVLIVCDGEDISLPRGYGHDMPFAVRSITIPHGGISAARNAGLKASRAEWIMFCDSDDAFLCTTSISVYIKFMRQDKVFISSAFYEEAPSPTENRMLLLWHDGKDYVFVHGKAFRREWLLKNKIGFNDELQLHEDTYFVAMVRYLAAEENSVFIEDPLYLWQYNAKSVSRSHDNFVLETYDQLIKKNAALTDELLRRGMYVQAKAIVCRTITDAYCRFNNIRWKKPGNEELLKDAEDCVALFYQRYEYIYKGADDKLIRAGLKAMRDPMIDAGVFDQENAPPYDVWFEKLKQK